MDVCLCPLYVGMGGEGIYLCVVGLGLLWEVLFLMRSVS